jgi:hypothetical protein
MLQRRRLRLVRALLWTLGFEMALDRLHLACFDVPATLQAWAPFSLHFHMPLSIYSAAEHYVGS